jgi:hypothetical protein
LCSASCSDVDYVATSDTAVGDDAAVVADCSAPSGGNAADAVCVSGKDVAIDELAVLRPCELLETSDVPSHSTDLSGGLLPIASDPRAGDLAAGSAAVLQHRIDCTEETDPHVTSPSAVRNAWRDHFEELLHCAEVAGFVDCPEDEIAVGGFVSGGSCTVTQDVGRCQTSDSLIIEAQCGCSRRAN